MQYSLRTNLARAKGLGSAKYGSHHWWMQRFTSIMLALLVIWLVFFIKSIVHHDLSMVLTILKKPYNIVPASLFTLVAFYHSFLGMRVIIEDYISCLRLRFAIIILLQIFTLVTVISLLVALFYILIL